MSVKKLLRRISLPLGVAVLVAVPVVAYADDTTIDINPGNVPTTAAGFEDRDCAQVPDDIGANEDGWVFVLPGNNGVFVSVTATFTDLDGDTRTATTGDSGGIDGGKGTSKAFIITPAGWTLTGATAEVDGTNRDKFNLTHACPGEVPPPDQETTPPPEETTTPPQETTSPPEETTTPPEETTTPPDQETTTPPEETTTPPDEETTTPPDEETTPPDEETTTPPDEETTSPDEETTSPDTQSSPPETESTTPVGKVGGGGGLTTTGLSVATFALAAVALVAAGIGALYLTRRRGAAE
ncbi:hypothetical protein GCM10027447_29450 [Glycomyces halotolerans]